MKILVICGPTASGKTGLAVECARRLGGEVISVDALLVYKKLNIGTAKPTIKERGGIPHHMIDVVEPTQSFSVGDYERAALPILERLIKEGKTPILCGGTGFYLNALLYRRSLGNTPGDEALRCKLETLARERGAEYLHGKLSEVDPDSAQSLHPNDLKRVIRALEIYALTGKRKSEQSDAPIPRHPFVAFSFDNPRPALYERIGRRVDDMMAAGLVGEVEELLRGGVFLDAQCMQGIGYKEVVGYLRGEKSLEETGELIKKNTRNYAKRQLTFFKKMQNLHWLPPGDATSAAEEVMRIYGQD